MSEAQQKINENLQKILIAAGSNLKHYTMQKSLNDLREAMRSIMVESYIEGSNACYEIYVKGLNHDTKR